MDNLYHQPWGFVQEPGRTIWTEAAGPRGGVAILIHPCFSIRTLESWQEDSWTRHWIAVRITHQEESILVINVYAPTDKGDREGLFELLRQQVAEHGGAVLVGGDFNCTLHPRIDRLYVTPADRHDSPALCRLLTRSQMSDVLKDEIDLAVDERSIPEFHASAHMYIYTLPGGGAAISRLDRWYVISCHANYDRDVHQSVPGPTSDHNGVTIRLGVPHCTVRVRRPRRVYPVPESAKADVKLVILAALRISLLSATKAARQRMTRSYKQRLRRLYERLDKALLDEPA